MEEFLFKTIRLAVRECSSGVKRKEWHGNRNSQGWPGRINSGPRIFGIPTAGVCQAGQYTNTLLYQCSSWKKRATNYRALLWKMTHKNKASYGSSPPCSLLQGGIVDGARVWLSNGSLARQRYGHVVQGGKNAWDALSWQFIFRIRAL